MEPKIYPLTSLPAGLTGHLEVTDFRAKRDWRDDAMGWAAMVATSLGAGGLVFDFFPLGILLAIVLVAYVWKAMDQVRVFTPGDGCSIKTVVEYDAQSSASEARSDVDEADASAA